MVTGRNVLLLVGVLSGFGVDTGLCARIRRPRDGSERLQNSPQAVPRGRNAGRASGVIIIPRNESSTIETPLPESVTVVKSISVDILSSSIPGENVAGAQSATGGAEGGSVVVDQGTQDGSSTSIKPSLSAGGMKAGVAAASSSTDAEDYIYPGVFGAGGTLTTDSRAPTRSIAPSKNSVAPKSGSVPGPPPGEASPRPGVLQPPTAPPVDDSDEGGGNVGDVGSNDGSDVGSDTSASHGVSEPLISETPAPTEPEPEPEAEPAPAPVAGGGPRPRPTQVRPTNAITNVIEETTDLGWVYPSSTASPLRNTTITWNFQNSTLHPGTGGVSPSPTVSYCQPSDYLNSVTALTTWSVVYTSTVTWTGRPEDYTPPFPPIVTPPPDKLRECVEPLPPPRLTLSVCTSTGTGTKYVTCIETTSTEWNFGPNLSTHTAVPTATIVFVTTDKNPAVVFSPIQTPNYGVTTQPRPKDPPQQNNHGPTKASQTTNAPPPYNSQKSQTPANPVQPQQPAQPGQPQQPGVNPAPQPQLTTPVRKPVTIIVRPSAVVIDGNTISDRPPVSTQVVVIDGRTFTIEPTRVVGEDATVTRPQSTNGGIFAPAPTSTTLGGVLVEISSGVAVVDGTQYTIGPVATTTNLPDGKPVVVGTGGVVVGGDTLVVPTTPQPTEVVVAGGELITAIGKSVVVIYGTTITYGVSGSVSTTTIGEDTIILGPSGITAAPGTTLGGALAKPGETAYALVGGVTITEIGESVLVINEATYTVGPGSPTITTEVSGERVTIGPKGVTIDTLSFAYPFGAASTTVIAAGRPAPSAVTVSPTGPYGYGWNGPGSGGDGNGGGGDGSANPQQSKDAAPGLVPGLRLSGGGTGSGIVSLVCIAIGVIVFGI